MTVIIGLVATLAVAVVGFLTWSIYVDDIRNPDSPRRRSCGYRRCMIKLWFQQLRKRGDR